MPATAPAAATRARQPAWWSPWSAPGATLAYAALSIVFTWPLATAVSRAIPWDMQDPLLNSWILAWSADHLWRFVTGHFDAFSGYWNANIFYPDPLALAYSEHLFAPALQVLPVWALTRNPILCYNLVLLGTFVLSGLGAFLLAHDLTGDRRAAFVAGIAFGFAPYRIGQLSHVQVLSAQWMPFALFALRRHLATDRWKWLAGFVAAMLLQHLSCGYYLVFFAPVLAAFVAFEVVTRHRWRDGALLARLTVAAAVIAAGTWPFLAPYLELRRLGFPPRQLDEVISFSANSWGYLTAHPSQWVWGEHASAYPRAEGELFTGVVVPALAAIAVLSGLWTAWRATAPDDGPGWRRAVAAAAAALLCVSVGLAGRVLAGGPLWLYADTQIAHVWTVADAVLGALGSGAVLLALSSRARHVAARLAASPECWFVLLAAGVAILSLGPVAKAGPAVAMPEAPYAWFYRYVPGYDGLRVPARYAMVLVLCLSMVAAYGVTALAAKTGRPALVAGLFALAALLEGGAAPLPLNSHASGDGRAIPLASLPSASHPPLLYRTVRTLPADAVLAEFPFGAEPWEVRYMFASTLHWRRLVNGYSGGGPRSYAANARAFRNVFRNPVASWARLRETGATNVIVHEAAFPSGRGPAVTAWLTGHGAYVLGRFGDDVLLQLPPLSE